MTGLLNKKKKSNFIKSRYLLLLTIIFAGILAIQTEILAQGNPPQAPTTTTNPTEEKNAESQPAIEEQNPNAAMSEAGKVHFGEDPTIWVLVILFNLALAVTIERIWVIRKNKSNNSELVKLLNEKLSANPTDVSDLEGTVKNNFGMEGRVASIALKGWKSGEESMKEYSSSALMAEKRNLEKRLVVLSTLGNNTPFIGLLGTVLGIMKAFRDLAAMGDSGPAVVMKGISEALVATAAGLAVAIPCVIAYNALSKIVKDKLSCAEEISAILVALRLSVKK